MKVYQKVPVLAGGNYSSVLAAKGIPGKPYIVLIDSVATSGWRSWTIPQGCMAISIQRRVSGAAVLVSLSATGTPYFTLKDTQKIKLDWMFAVAGTVLYFQAVSSACEVEILFWMEGSVPYTAVGASSSSSSSRSSSSSSSSSKSSSSSSSKSSSSSSSSSKSSSSSSSSRSSSSSSSSSRSSSSSSSSRSSSSSSSSSAT